MILLFDLKTPSAPSALEDAHSLSARLDARSGPTWVDVDSEDPAELEAVARALGVAPDTYEQCPLCGLHPEVEWTEAELRATTYEVISSTSDRDLGLRSLSIVLATNHLVTIRSGPSPTVEALSATATRTAPIRPSELLVELLHQAVGRMLGAAGRMKQKLEETEDASLADDADDSVLDHLGDVRQPVADLQRYAELQREALRPLERGQCPLLSSDECEEIEHIGAHLGELERRAEGLRDLSRTIRDNYNATLANRMNQVMMTLTIFASVLLPLSLITGFYGMNVPLWPSAEDPIGLPFAVALMVLVTGALLLYFRKKKFL